MTHIDLESCVDNSITIPSGNYNIVITNTTCNPGYLSFPAKAGKRYFLKYEGSPGRNFWIEDEKTGEYVGGSKPESHNDVNYIYQRYCSKTECGVQLSRETNGKEKS